MRACVPHSGRGLRRSVDQGRGLGAALACALRNRHTTNFDNIYSNLKGDMSLKVKSDVKEIQFPERGSSKLSFLSIVVLKYSVKIFVWCSGNL
jgi:hypothetical protein